MRSDTLTRDQIVKAAIALLDADGLEGLNMRALGKRLGAAATAVYWHLGSKDDLVALAGDRVWNEIALPDLTASDWRTAATSMATELYAMLTRHLWLLQAFGSVMVYGPGKARYDDHSLALYEAAGFAGAQAERAATTVFTYVLGNALGSAATATLTRKLADAGEDPATANHRLSEQGLIGGLLEVVPLTEEDAVVIAQLRTSTSVHGLSLGDRACLATGLRFSGPVLTDRRRGPTPPPPSTASSSASTPSSTAWRPSSAPAARPPTRPRQPRRRAH
jgi:AcrR family transcriptional regulator